MIMNDNAIRDVEQGIGMGLKSLGYLRIADFSNNNIQLLSIFEKNIMIASIRMTNNLIQNLMEVYYLDKKQFLTQ